ncbi:MAG: serine/threonine protein phosphatase [Clostridia bacterium]|nr:serine/threonine protein phosphatase [Clostridia bacterium]
MLTKPTVSYKGLRLKNITSPEYRHLFLILGWPLYFALYYLTENFIPNENCHIVHSFFDDIIPFSEIFVIPYVLWYALIAFSLIYFLFYSLESFKALQTYFIIVQLLATVIFIVYPSKQMLRPEEFARDNLLTDLVGALYSADTNTGVCPSLHVAMSIGIASAWLKEKSAHWTFKAFIVLFCIIICLSTAFIKQHSVVDTYVAIPVCMVAEIIVFYKWYKAKLKRK